MRWECTECGEVVGSVSPPEVCSRCGLAVGVFVLADDEDADVSWTRLGEHAYAAQEASVLRSERA